MEIYGLLMLLSIITLYTFKEELIAYLRPVRRLDKRCCPPIPRTIIVGLGLQNGVKSGSIPLLVKDLSGYDNRQEAFELIWNLR
nr:expressed protein [Hymenolepis microstoma]